MPVSASTSTTRRSASCGKIPMPAGSRAARQQAPRVGRDQCPCRGVGAGQRGQQGLALRPAVPRAVSAAALVEIPGAHLTAVGGYGRAAQGQLPVPVCVAVRGAGGVGGPAVEHHLGGPDPDARASGGWGVCWWCSQVIRRPRAWRGRPRERVPVICFLPVRLLIRCGAVPAGAPARSGPARGVPGPPWYLDSSAGFKCAGPRRGLPCPGRAAAWPGRPGPHRGSAAARQG